MGSVVYAHGPMFESWQVPCGREVDFHGMYCVSHSGSLKVLGCVEGINTLESFLK